MKGALAELAKFGYNDEIEAVLSQCQPTDDTERLEALESACTYGHLECAKRLIGNTNATELIYNTNHTNVIEFLLGRVDPSFGSLVNAARKGSAGLVDILLQRADQSAKMGRVLTVAAKKGHASIVKLLLADERVDPAADDNEAFREAAAKGHVEVIRLLLADKRVDPAACGNVAFREAAAKGHIEVVKLLLADKRVDPSTRFNVAFREAAGKGHAEVVRLLLTDKRVNPAARDNEAIRLAAKRRYFKVISLLLKDGRIDPQAGLADAADAAAALVFISFIDGPLDVAFAQVMGQRRRALADLIFEANNPHENRFSWCLIYAAGNNCADAIKWMIELNKQ